MKGDLVINNMKKGKKINLVCKARIDKYRKITETALKKAEKSISKSREKQAKQILTMVKCYLSDSVYFEKQNNLVDAFAAINYAHGWLDCGARLGIFKVKDSKLFTIK